MSIKKESRRIIIIFSLLLLLNCEKKSEPVEYDTENKFDDIYAQAENAPKVNNDNKENIPKEEIVFKNKLEILAKINDCIVKEDYEGAKKIINDIDINKYVGGLYKLFQNDKIKTEDKIELIKYITDGKISNPYMLIYLSPNEYDAFINEFITDINAPIDELGRSILHLAAPERRELFDYLLTKSININAVDNIGHNALFYMFEFHPLDWYNPITEDENHVEINWTDDSCFYGSPYYGYNIANKETRWFSFLNELLENGINVNQRTNYGWTVLHFCKLISTDIVYNILLSYNADESILTNYGRTPNDLQKYAPFR